MPPRSGKKKILTKEHSQLIASLFTESTHAAPKSAPKSSSTSADESGNISESSTFVQTGTLVGSKNIYLNEALSSISVASNKSAPATLFTYFHAFSKFPQELQLMTFKQALPTSDPRIIKFRFKLDIDVEPAELHTPIDELEAQGYRENVILLVKSDTSSGKSPDILPLLLTSKMSNEAVSLGGFEKIAISFPDNCSNRIREYVDRAVPRLIIKYVKGSSWRRSHTWMRPSTDILFMHAKDLDALYTHGGSMNLSNITHIALHNKRKSTPYTVLSGDPQGKIEARELYKSVFEIIQAHCPALKKLSLLVGDDLTEYSIEKDLEADQLGSLIDIDEKFYQLDFKDGSEGQRSADMYDRFILDHSPGQRSVDEDGRFGLEQLWLRPETAPELQDTSSVMAEYLKECIEDKGTISYWEKVQVVPALRTWPDHNERSTWVSEVVGVVPWDADGNLTYKVKEREKSQEAEEPIVE